MNKILQNKKIITHTLIIVAIIFLAVISLQSGFAATNSINNTTSGGINGALSTSNPGDIIELDEGIYTGNNNTNMTINKNITIQGKTKDKVILDAQKISKIFTIANNTNVIFINITFINANSTSSNGAAISTNVNSNISLTVDNCEFINNTAPAGGAIWINGNNIVKITNSFFVDNVATVGGGGLIITGISNNVTIINSNFTNNYASGDGGAISLAYVNAIITGCNFNNNSGNSGGTIHIQQYSNVTITTSIFNNSDASGFGGAIRSYAYSNLTVITSIFNNCTSVWNGGAIFVDIGEATIIGSTFTNNSADRNGDAIYVTGNVTISDNNMADNKGNNVIYVNRNSNSNITNNNITDNKGTGIVNNGNVTIVNNNVSGNFGDDIVNNGDINGSGNFNNVQTGLAINTSVSYNKVTINVKATDKWGNVIVGRLISFYVNGKLVGSSITNNEGIAEFVYTASVSGTYNIIAKMNESDESDTFITRIYSANTSTIAKVVLEKDTVITISAPTIKEGKKTNIKVTLKDINGNILKNKKVSLKINGKTYTATTNNKGIAVFKIAGLKGGKHTLTAKFAGDNNYKSSTITKVQKVNAKSNLGIVSIKKLSTNKRLSKCKVTIANKGSLKSKATTLALFHMRKGIKIKTKYIKIKSIAPGKKISLIVSYFPDKANHRYCIAHFQVDPKNKNKEIILANNKKSISLKH